VSEVSRAQVEAAYQALATGDRARIAEHYDEDLRWLVPGCHAMAGRYEGLGAFLAMMDQAHKLTGGTFAMQPLVVMTGDGCSSDVCRNTARRAASAPDCASAYDRLDAEVFHFLRWRDGRIVEGRDGLFGDDATAFSQFWSPIAGDGTRITE
jgi:ketosteroid isomerase-like protein